MRNMLKLSLVAILVFSPSLALAQDKPADAPKAPAVSDADAKKAEGLFDAGRKLFFQGKYKESIGALADAVKLDPTRSTYKLLLAKAHRYAGEAEKAADLLAAILKENPEHVEAAITLAEMLSPRKQPDKVIATLSPLLKFKHDYSLFHMLGDAYYEKEQLDDAAKMYQQAVTLNPRAGQDYYQLGNIHLTRGKFAKAADAYEHAAALGIDEDVFHFKVASVYFNLRNYLGRIDTAKVIGGKVGDIKDDWLLIDPVPGQPDTFYVASARSAIYHAVRARQLGISMPGLSFLEANIWLNARRYAKAEEIYKALEGKLDKSEVGLFWYYWAQTALGLDQVDTYLARLDKAIAAAPDVYKPTLADAYVTVALRHQQRGDSAKHLEFLGKAVETNPLSASLHLSLGDAHWQLGHREKAIEQYKLVLELEPDNAQRVRLFNRIRGEEDIPQPSKDGPTRTAEK